MFKRKGLASAIVAVALMPAAGLAETESGQYVVRGIGAQRCVDVAEGYAKDRARQLELSSWIAAYTTTANMTQDGVFDIFPSQNNAQIAGLVALICRSKPETSVAEIIGALGRLFAPLAVNGESPFVEVKSGEASVTVREETVTDVQNALVTRGLLTQDDVDGAFGPTTSSALKAFQKKRGIRETGVPDILTMYWLVSSEG